MTDIPPQTLLVTDIGSTTTKALLFQLAGDRYNLVGTGHAPTTVEAPTEDVTVGLLNAVKALEANIDHKLLDDGALAIGKGFDTFLATSSAGGGLQILVSGLAKTVTAKSAYRAAGAAGGVILDVLAVDDGRKPHEKVEAIEELRPDMILVAGGVDGGDVVNVARMAAVIQEANLRPKYIPEGKMPVIFAGNVNARNAIETLLGERVDLVNVENLRPTMDTENLDPTRRAIHEMFARHVMARAPGYSKVGEWTGLPVEPTPAAVERLISAISSRRQSNIIMVDIGGATTDVFSHHGGAFNRTVSANLGMSYSASHVLLETGAGNIMRWLTGKQTERQVRNMIANKCINPTRLPESDTELDVEHALAREALRVALKAHRELSIRVHKAARISRLKSMFHHDGEFDEHEYVRMDDVEFIFGSGGVLSHAPWRWQAAQMLIDGLQPEGVTMLGVDSVFMTPHLGTLARFSEDIAIQTFGSECYVPLGTCIAFSGRIRPGRYIGSLAYDVAGRSDEVPLEAGDVLIIGAGANEQCELDIRPARKVDAGAGPGKALTIQCSGGEAGIIIDARGRPIEFPDDEWERTRLVKAWEQTFREERR
ncbi:MAG: glutamate mutase L [Planctomycetota bacterium]|jgi:uncharacterized protein (TIGR01319 family)